MNVCPACACRAVAHARTVTEVVHGPLQRKLDPPAAMARSPMGTPSAAYGSRRRPELANEADRASLRRLSKPTWNIRLSMRWLVSADNRLSVYLGRVSSRNLATDRLTEAAAVVEPSSATGPPHQISRRLCRCLTTQSQRPGAREATIATTTPPPASLQRMVRPPVHFSMCFRAWAKI
jgi:hypothetical protein